MYEKLQELEESFSMEQRRLLDMTPEPVIGDFDGDGFDAGADEFSDYGLEDDMPAADDAVRVLLEDSVPLEQAEWVADAPPPSADEKIPVSREAEAVPEPPVAGLQPQPAAGQIAPDDEAAPKNEQPPSWENLLGLAGPSPAASEEAPAADEAQPQPVVEQDETEVEAEEPAFEGEKTAVEPADEPPSVSGEVVEPTAPNEAPGGSLLWDWRSLAVEKNGGEAAGWTAVSMLEPGWEPDEDNPDAPVDSEAGDDFAEFDPVRAWEADGDDLSGLDETNAVDEEDFSLLADEEERELSPDVPLPDELDDWE
jgi:hypothetical protein